MKPANHMKRTALMMLAPFCLLALAAVAGCAGPAKDPGSVTVMLAQDVPVPAGFVLSKTDPVPRTEEVSGGYRFHSYAYVKDGAFGYDNAAKHFSTVLPTHGWTKNSASMESSATATNKQKWLSRWLKGKGQMLQVSYEERIGADKKTVSRIFIRIEGSE
jgi:hypothetical protein